MWKQLCMFKKYIRLIMIRSWLLFFGTCALFQFFLITPSSGQNHNCPQFSSDLAKYYDSLANNIDSNIILEEKDITGRSLVLGIYSGRVLTTLDKFFLIEIKRSFPVVDTIVLYVEGTSIFLLNYQHQTIYINNNVSYDKNRFECIKSEEILELIKELTLIVKGLNTLIDNK